MAVTERERALLQSVIDLGGANVSIASIASDLGMSATKTLHLRLKQLSSRRLLTKKENRSGAAWGITPAGRRSLDGNGTPTKSPIEPNPASPARPRARDEETRFLAEESCPFCGTIGRLYFPDAEMKDTLECLTCKKLAEVGELNGHKAALLPGIGVKSFVAANQKLPCSECGIPIADGTRIYRPTARMDSVRHVECPEVPKVTYTPGRKSVEEEAELQRIRLEALPKDRWLSSQEVILVFRKNAACLLPGSTSKAPTAVVNYLRRCARTGCILVSDPEMRLASGDVEWYVPSDIKDYASRETTRPDIAFKSPSSSADKMVESMREWTSRPDIRVVERVQEAVAALPQRVSMRQFGPVLDGRIFYLKQLEALLKVPLHTAKLIVETLLRKGVLAEQQWRSPRAYKFLAADEQPYNKDDYIRGCKALELQRHQTGEVPTLVGAPGTRKTPTMCLAAHTRESISGIPPKKENADPPPPTGEHPMNRFVAKRSRAERIADEVAFPESSLTRAVDIDQLDEVLRQADAEIHWARAKYYAAHAMAVAKVLEKHLGKWAADYAHIEIIVRPTNDPIDVLYVQAVDLTK